jgi:hypothetical protein
MIVLALRKRELLDVSPLLCGRKIYMERIIIQRSYDYSPSDFCPVEHLEYPCFGRLSLALIAHAPSNSRYFIFHISIDIPADTTSTQNTQALQSQPPDGIWQCHYFRPAANNKSKLVLQTPGRNKMNVPFFTNVMI